MAKLYRLFSLAIIVLAVACTNKKNDNQLNETNVMNTNSDELFLLVGTYNANEGDDGIFLYKLNRKTGVSDSLYALPAHNPSYLTLSKDEQYIYAVGESGNNSTVSAFSFDKENSTISHINTVPSGGADPCYIEVDDSGNNLFTANYSGGSISSFSTGTKGEIIPANLVINFEGSGPDRTRQASSHLHSVRISPDSKFLFATDLGADKVYRFPFTNSVFEGQPSITQSALQEFDTPAEMGPRHLDFHPSGKYLYLLGEISGEVVVYDYDDGMISQKQAILSDTLGARGAGDIHVSPNGKFLYSSNRLKGDGIAIFSINEDTGELTKVGYQDTGKHPRNFVISPDGALLLVACRDDNRIQVFAIDEHTGLLMDTHNDILVGKPVCLKIV